jgi:hypothetical protein
MRSFAVPSVHRMLRVLLAVMFAWLLVMPSYGAFADEPAAVVLAVEGGDLGPQPADRLAEDNPARELIGYDDRDIPFTWGAAWILAFTGFMGLGSAALLYRLKVVRPQRQA